MKPNDAELIQRILADDQGAFTALMKKYQKQVHALAWRKVGDFHIAEEITQDTFLKVYQNLATLKHPQRFAGWLYVITNQRCIAWLRKSRRPMQSLESMPAAEVEELSYFQHLAAQHEETATTQRRAVVKHLLQKLPESERTVVTLHYLGEMSCEEISRFLGVSPNTIKSRLHRARKRLKKEEHMVRETLGSFQLSPTLMENIMKQISRIKPTSPAASKPLVPWALAASTAVLVVLMLGVGNQYLIRFQQPYSFEATSEMTVDIVDEPIVLNLASKPDVRNQLGRADAPGRGAGNAGPKAASLLIAAAQVDEVPFSKPKPMWHQTGPKAHAVSTLFVTSEKELYAVSGRKLYKLAAARESWALSNANLPESYFGMPMAERRDTLYLVTEAGLLASIDRGETWHAIGTRPKGRAADLLVTDEGFYLAIEDSMFGSTDAGKTWHLLKRWHPINNSSRGPALRSAAAVDNTVFVGTSQGLYRLNAGIWEKLPVAPSQTIDSLAVADNRIYLSAGKRQDQRSSSLFTSTDLGDSWTEITPTGQNWGMDALQIGFVKVVAVGDTVLALGAGVLRSTDGGSTWENLGFHKHAFTHSIFPAVALDENTFFRGGANGIGCSTDGGDTWHPFIIEPALHQPKVLNLARVKNVLYAATPKGVIRSTDGGTRWTEVGIAPGVPSQLSEGAMVDSRWLTFSKLAAVDQTVYVKTHHLNESRLFCLAFGSWAFVPVEGMPTCGKTYIQWAIEAAETIDNGGFAVSGDTFYVEYERKLFRWRSGEREWHDTGFEDTSEGPYSNNAKAFELAALGESVYVGKRDGHLFQSRDSGDSWHDITANLPFRFEWLEEIAFAGSTVYVATNEGVITSSDGVNWHAVTDSAGARLVMNHFAVDDTFHDNPGVYAVSDEGIYRLKSDTMTWKQIVSEVPPGATSLLVDGDMLYVGTENRGVFRLQLKEF